MNCTGSSFSQLRLSCSFSSMVSIPFIELSFSLHRLLFHFFLPAQLNNCITKSVLVNYRSMNMTTKREKTVLMPQSNYSRTLQNQQHKVKLLMRSIIHFLHIPSLISWLTFSLITQVSIPLFLFLLSLSLSCILWPLCEDFQREVGRVTYEREDGIRNVTEQRDIKWQFPSDPKVANSIPHRTGHASRHPRCSTTWLINSPQCPSTQTFRP